MSQSSLLTTLAVDRDVIETINQAINSKPACHEVCGFLLGLHEQHFAKISHAYLVRNGVTRSGGFSISISEEKRTLRYADKHELELCAFFHTHPCGQPSLSETDRSWLKYSNQPWVVFTPTRNDEPTDIQVEAFQPGNGEPLTVLFAN